MALVIEDTTWAVSSGSGSAQCTATGLDIAGTDRMVVALVGFNNDAWNAGSPSEVVTSVTIDPGGGSQTQLAFVAAHQTPVDDGRVEVWAVQNPPVGTFSIRSTLNVALLTNDHGHFLGAWAVSGVHPDTPIRGTAGDAGEDRTSWAPSVSTHELDLVLGLAFVEDAAAQSLPLASPSTQQATLTSPHDRATLGHQVASGATTTMTWTTSPMQNGVAAVVALVPGAGEPPEPPPFPSDGQVIVPLVETAMYASGSADISDDPAIYVDPTDPADSLILGSNKNTGSAGGIGIFGLNGALLHFANVGETNNVDLRQNPFGDGRTLVVGSNRNASTIWCGWLNPGTPSLTHAGSVSLTFVPYGICLYVSPVDGDVYAFVNGSSSHPTELRQYRLTLSGDTVSGSQVRNLGVPSLAEGMCADDERGVVFVGVEDVELRRYGAEPGDGTGFTVVDTAGGGNLVADIEGVAVVRDPLGRTELDALLVSSQGDSSFHLYLIETLEHVARFTVGANSGLGIDAVADTDGLDAIRTYMGPAFPHGIVVVHDATNTGGPQSNFKFLDAADVFGGPLVTRMDAVGLVDGVSGHLTIGRAAGDVAGVTDVVAAQAVMGRAPADVAGLTDTVASVVDAHHGTGDTEGLVDQALADASAHRATGDVVGLGDATTAAMHRSRGHGDPVTLADEATTTTSSARTVGDVAGVTDSVTASLVSSGEAVPEDTATLTDEAAATLTAVRTTLDALGLTDAVVASLASVGDATPSDAAGLTDDTTTTAAAARDEVDHLAATDTVATSTTTHRPAADVTGLLDGVTVTLTVAGHATPGDPLALTDAAGVDLDTARSTTASVGLTDAVTAALHRVVTVADLLALVDTPAADTGTTVAEADDLAATDHTTWTTTARRAPHDGAGLADSCVAVMDRTITLTDVIGALDDTTGGTPEPPTITHPRARLRPNHASARITLPGGGP